MMTNYEQMFAAINALAPASVMMRKPGDWYVRQSGVDVKRGRLLCSAYGNGDSPEAAIRDHWTKLTSVAAPHYIVLIAGGPGRTAVRWNGFMWERVQERSE